MAKDDVKNFTFEELKQAMVEIREAAFRAKQIYFWLYRRGVPDFNQMRNMAKTTRDKLEQRFYISHLDLAGHLRSTDGTEKFLFRLKDGNFIETVLIPAGGRKTVCLSTQVGCKFACPFCASGLMTFVRNLTVSEIIDQVLFLHHNLKHEITNYVFMGMGEPLDNYENVSKAIVIMNDSRGLDIGARRIAVSTCGIIPGIEQLKDLGLQINLSLSLHATNDRLRNALVPVNKCYPLEKLIKACEDFIAKAGRMITLDYILIEGRNDSLPDANALAAIAKRLRAKVNLIPCSPATSPDFQSSQRKKRDVFIKRLVDRKVNVTLRKSRGKDIRAACGQLAGRAKKGRSRYSFNQ